MRSERDHPNLHSPKQTDTATASAVGPAPTRPGVVRIYKPARSAMQAGRAGARSWILEFEPSSRPAVEPLMGWTASADVNRQVRLAFATREQAVVYAEKHGLRYSLSDAKAAPPRPKSYAANFLRGVED